MHLITVIAVHNAEKNNMNITKVLNKKNCSSCIISTILWRFVLPTQSKCIHELQMSAHTVKKTINWQNDMRPLRQFLHKVEQWHEAIQRGCFQTWWGICLQNNHQKQLVLHSLSFLKSCGFLLLVILAISVGRTGNGGEFVAWHACFPSWSYK